jgi:hypothetical protein
MKKSFKLFIATLFLVSSVAWAACCSCCPDGDCCDEGHTCCEKARMRKD